MERSKVSQAEIRTRVYFLKCEVEGGKEEEKREDTSMSVASPEKVVLGICVSFCQLEQARVIWEPGASIEIGLASLCGHFLD